MSTPSKQPPSVPAQRSYLNRTETPLLVSVPAAAHLLGIGKSVAWDMIRTGELPKVRLRGRVLVPRSALERLAGMHGMPPAERGGPTS